MDGLIAAPTGKSKKEFEGIGDVPIVFVDRRIPEIEADAVLSKNVEGAFRATKYLIAEGHDRIGMILGLKDILTSSERFEGYSQAIRQANIDHDDSLVVRGNFKVPAAVKATEQLLSLQYPPSAILTVNNKTTQGALKAIKQSHFDWPSDIEIVGFDDLDCLSFLNLPLTTVKQNPKELGKKSAQLLFEKIEDNENKRVNEKVVRVGVELNIRKDLHEQ